MMFQYVIFKGTDIVRKKKTHENHLRIRNPSFGPEKPPANCTSRTTLKTLSISHLMYVHIFIYSSYINEYYVPLS